MASLVDTPRSRFQRAPASSSVNNVSVTTASSSTATPKNPARLPNPFSGESTCRRQNFPDFSPSVFTHHDTPAEARIAKKFQWSIDEMAHLQPADIDENTAQAFHCTPKRDTAKQQALDKFFLQQHVVVSPHVSCLSAAKKTAIKHVTFSPLPPATKYITRDEDMSSGESGSESAMDVGDETRRHSVCIETSSSLMVTDEALPPNCVQMESMAELKDMSLASLRRKLFGPNDRSGSPSSRDNSPSFDARDPYCANKQRFPGKSDEPAITPGEFLSMGSEEDSDCEPRVMSRRSWGRCSSSPTNHGEQMEGLCSSPIGTMEEPVFPPLSLCESPQPEAFGHMDSLDLSPISPRDLQQLGFGVGPAGKENDSGPLASTLRPNLCQPYPNKEMEMSVTGSFGDFGGGDSVACSSSQRDTSFALTPLSDRTNQPSTLRMSQLATLGTPSQFCIALGEQDMPMFQGGTSAFSPLRRSVSEQAWRRPQVSLSPQQASSTDPCMPMDSTGEFSVTTGAASEKAYGWSHQGSTPVSRHRQQSTATAFNDWQRSVNSWQNSIRSQLAEFDQTRGTPDL